MLDEALDRADEDNLAGVGFVFVREKGIIGIDLDDCRDPVTGELTPMAQCIVDRFNSYTEISPSGTGLHIYVLGSLPPGRSREGDIEMYASGRYFTVTGQRLPSSPTGVEERQSVIDALHAWISEDADLVEQARCSNPSFSSLWDGDTAEYGGDPSRADLALCNMLAPRCNYDPERTDRIFRWSGMMRDKWDEKHYAEGETYGAHTIGKALKGRGGAIGQQSSSVPGTSQTALHVVNGHEIYMKDLPPTKWYVANILHEGACLLCGDPKVGKSFLALQIAVAVAGKKDTVCGAFKVGVHGRVLYLALDDGSEKRIHERLHQLTDDEDAVRQIDFVYQRNLPSLADGLDKILDLYLSEHHYTLVVLDTLGAVLEVNSNKSVYRGEYKEAIKLQKLAQERGICLLVLHHTNKSDSTDVVTRASGSHGLTGAVDSVLLLTRQCLSARPRDGEESEHSLKRLSTGGWEVSNGETVIHPAVPCWLNGERQEVKDALAADPKDRETLAKELGVTDEAMRKRLQRMAKGGQVRKLPDGRYEWISAEFASDSSVPVERPQQAVSETDPCPSCPNCPSIQGRPEI